MPKFVDPIRRFARSEFVRHSILIFVSTTMANLFGYVFHFFISRLLGVQNYGELTSLVAVLVMTAVPATIATTVVVKYASEFRAAQDLGHLRALVRAILIYVSGVAVLVVVLGILASGAIASYLNIASRTDVALTIVLLGFNLVLPVLRGVLQGTEDFVSFAIALSLEAVTRAVLGVTFVYAGYGVVGALVGWTIGTALALTFSIFVLGVRYRLVPRAPLFIDLRRLVQTSSGVALGTLMITSLSYTDVVMVKHAFGATEAGLYGVISLSGKMLFFLVSFVPTIVLPKASSRAASGQNPLPILVQAVGIVVLLAGGGLLVLHAFPLLVVTALAGKAFVAAAPLVFPYGLATTFLAALNAVVFYKMGIHRFDFIWPLAFVAVGEVVAISLRHDSLRSVVQILVVGHALGFVLSLHRVGVSNNVRQPAMPFRESA